MQIEGLLDGAEKDNRAAADLIALGYSGLACGTAYESMLKCGIALMLHHGFRPQSGGHHSIVVRFTGLAIGEEYGELTASFDRLRRNRHRRLYQGIDVSTVSQAQRAVDTAGALRDVVIEFIGAE